MSSVGTANLDGAPLIQILWTEECERSLEEYENGAEDAVKKYLEVCCIRLDGLIKLVQGE